MKPVRILVDSTVDLPERCRAQVRAVPLTVHFGDEELIDGVTIDRRRFYERLIESDVLPTTSQATPAAFVKEFEAVRQAGESAVVITISAELSGTYQSACIAAADYEDIYVVDSRSAAIGSGILAELALEWAADGMAAAELAGLLTKKRDDICLLGLLDTLEYLRRGGRISRTAALAGGLLGIKPVVTLENGAVTMIGKARGSKQGNNLLVQKVREQRHRLFPADPARLHRPERCPAAEICGGQRGALARSLRQSGADAAVQCDRHTYGAGCRSGRVLQERCLSAVKL